MKPLIYRKNLKFYIDEVQLKPEARTPEIINALYSEMYVEFLGAVDNPIYSKLTPLQKMEKINEFAFKWLTKKGYI